MTKQEKQTIKQLKETKNYEEIFKQFGQKTFVKSVDRKYKKQDIQKLMYEGKFEDIYLRYGTKTYNRKLREFKQREIEEIYGKKSIQAIIGRIKLAGVGILTGIGIGTGVNLIGNGITIGGNVTEAINTTIDNAENYREATKEGHEEEIEQYMESIENYAEYIRTLNLTDLETIMKVQEDMWATIEGYKDPEIDIEGCYGLDIGISKKGVCRHMADDVARKLNTINPEYNARVCLVVAKENVENEEVPNINRTIFELQKQCSQYNGLEVTIPSYVKTENLSTNHVVTLVDIKQDNLTLIVDPTNVFIGIFQNGEIYMLNVQENERDGVLERRPWADLFWRDDISMFDLPKEYIKSFLQTKLHPKEIEEKYGVKAQNEALETASKKELDYMYKLNKEGKGFRESLEVNPVKNIYTVEEIKRTYQKLMQIEEQNLSKEQKDRIIEEICKLRNSIFYYDHEKEMLLGAPILNSSMLLQEKLEINTDELSNKEQAILGDKEQKEYEDSTITSNDSKIAYKEPRVNNGSGKMKINYIRGFIK